MWGVKKHRHMLWGSPFIILTDHRALVYLDSCKDKTARLARWFEFLSAFQYEIQYKEGTKHGNADGVSRNPLDATEEDERIEEQEALVEAYALEAGDASDPVGYATAELLAVMEQVDEVLSPDNDGIDAPEQGISLLHNEGLGEISTQQWHDAQNGDAQLAEMIQFIKSQKALGSDVSQRVLLQKLCQGCWLQRRDEVELLVRIDWKTQGSMILHQYRLSYPSHCEIRFLTCCMEAHGVPIRGWRARWPR